MKRIILALLMAAHIPFCISAKQFIINGIITDASDSEPIEFASVAVEGNPRGSITNERGEFSLIVDRAGKYTVKASMTGYADATKGVVLTDERPVASVNIGLAAESMQMDELVVSANRNVVRRSEAPVIVGVLSTKLFDAVNSADLAQTLNYQSGLRVENNCQNCGFPQVRINGLEGPYSQVLVNSRPVVSSLSGVYALEQMPVNMIERIEVVRGGGSALFGANAVGGTINVITKEPIDNRFEAGTTISEMNGTGTWEEVMTANANVVAPSGNYGVALYETYRHRDPYDRDGDGFSEVGKLNLNTLGFNAFYRLSETQKVTLEYHNTSEFRRGGNKFDLEPFRTDITEQTQHNINSGGVNYLQNWRNYSRRLDVYASLQHISRSSYYGAQQNPDAYGRTTDFTAVTGATFTADFPHVVVSPAVFTSGVEYQTNRLHDVMTGYGRDMRQNVDIFGVFVQNEWKMKHFTFLAGLRLDSHNLIDNPIVSPRLNLLYRPSSAIQARVTWSTGFRAPQAYDEDLHVTAVGGEGVLISLADGLKPERSNSLSASLDYDFRIGAFDCDLIVEGFHTDLSNVFVLDAIGTDEKGNTLKVRRNGDGARVTGANIDLKAGYGGYMLQIGFTAQTSRYRKAESWSEDPDVAPTRQMPRAPSTYGYFTLTGSPFRNFTASLSGVYTGRMYVPHFAPAEGDVPADSPYKYISKDTLYHSPSFMELNLKLAYTVRLREKMSMEIGLGVHNLTDAFQKDLDRGAFRDSGYFYGPTSPRTYFASVRFSGI